jgi:chromosome segregation ATPase
MNHEDEMRDWEERRSKIVAFVGLKQEEQKKEMEKLSEKLGAISEEKGLIRKATETCQADLKRLEEEVASVKNKYSEARAKRQNLFALGMDTKDLDSEIWKLHLDLEAGEVLRTDAIAGLGNRLSDLSEELTFLEEEESEIKRSILEFQQVPLIPKFNKEIAQAMKTFEQILEGQDLLNYTFQAAGGSRFQMIYLSDWEFLGHLGKLYFTGNIAEEDRRPFGRLRGIWSLHEYRERKQKKLADAASE